MEPNIDLAEAKPCPRYSLLYFFVPPLGTNHLHSPKNVDFQHTELQLATESKRQVLVENLLRDSFPNMHLGATKCEPLTYAIPLS